MNMEDVKNYIKNEITKTASVYKFDDVQNMTVSNFTIFEAGEYKYIFSAAINSMFIITGIAYYTGSSASCLFLDTQSEKIFANHVPLHEQIPWYRRYPYTYKPSTPVIFMS